MTTRMTRSLLLAAGALAYHGSASALALGDLTVHSSLNQPLHADLVLLQANPADAERVRVSVRPAAPTDPRSPAARFVERFRPSVLINPAGQLTVEITSPESIREPILNFIVEVRMPDGAVTREFSVLLDPPGYRAAERAGKSGSQTRPRAVVAAAPIQHGPQGAVYGPVQPNDTLWRIASRVRTDKTVSVAQMVEALFQANPQAFIDGDRNRLKVWSTLKIPGREAAPAALSGRQEPQPSTAAAATPPAALPPQAAPPAPVPAALAQVNAQIAASDAEAGQLKTRLQSLKDDVARLQAQSDQRDAQIAALLANLAAKTTTTAATPAAQPQPGAAPVRLQSPPPAESSHPAVAATAGPQPGAAAGKAPLAAAAMLPAANATALALALAAALSIGALAFGAYRWRQRRRSQQGWHLRKHRDAELLSTVAQKASERLQLEEEVGALVPSRDRKPAEPTEEQLLRQQRDQLLQEVDLHLAYGHYGQAEAVLNAALEQEPGNLELQFKLADVHAHAGDPAAFLEVARSLNGRPEARAGRQWATLAEMGRKLCPDEPLFGDETDQDGVVTSAQILKFARR